MKAPCLFFPWSLCPGLDLKWGLRLNPLPTPCSTRPDSGHPLSCSFTSSPANLCDIRAAEIYPGPQHSHCKSDLLFLQIMCTVWLFTSIHTGKFSPLLSTPCISISIISLLSGCECCRQLFSWRTTWDCLSFSFTSSLSPCFQEVQKKVIAQNCFCT